MSAHQGFVGPAAAARTHLRAGDRDRHEAVQMLTDHFSDGRLDQDEFDRRLSDALTATYLGDLDALFVDLPARSVTPVPAVRPSHPRPARLSPFMRVALAIAALAVVLQVGLAPLFLVFGIWFVLSRSSRRRERFERHCMQRAAWHPGWPDTRYDIPDWPYKDGTRR